MKCAVAADKVVPTSTEAENLRFLAQAAIARLEPSALGYVSRRGTVEAGEDWFAAGRIIGRCRRTYDLIPQLARVVGTRNAAALVVYHRQYRDAPCAAEVLDGRTDVPLGTSSHAAQAAALAYEVVDRAAGDPRDLRTTLKRFAWNVEHRLPFKSAALAVHLALYLTDLEPLVVDVPAWASMEVRIRRDLDSFLERRAASIRT
ncbi:hypothetical protein [Methylobacterium brachiatum]